MCSTSYVLSKYIKEKNKKRNFQQQKIANVKIVVYHVFEINGLCKTHHYSSFQYCVKNSLRHCANCLLIRKTYLCIEKTLIPHLYIAELGFTAVYLFSLFLFQNIDCGYSLEPASARQF